MNASSENLGNLIREIKRRWVMRAVIQGSAVLVVTFLLSAALYLLLLYRYDLTVFWQSVILIIVGVTLLAEVMQLLIRPLFKRFSDQRIALFIEEKFPELEDRLNSAVEINVSTLRDEQNRIIDMLIDDAAQKARTIQISTVVDRKKQQILSYVAYALVLIAVLAVVSFREELGMLRSRMAFLFYRASGYQPEMTISPGDTQVEKGESQEIMVTLRRSTDDEVTLHYRTPGDVWHTEQMLRGVDEPSYLHLLASIQEPVNYYVEFRDTVSPEYTITIYEFPKVGQIDLEYTYPSYTGMPPRREEDAGNIRGLKGSEVTLTITTTGNARTAELVIDGEQSIPLAPQGGGVFSGAIAIQDYGSYYVHLVDDAEKSNKFPNEYLITPVEDERPLITITDPKRDLRVNPVEEVIIAAVAEDDFGLTGLRLNYSINGGDEQVVELADESAQGLPEVSGSHVMYLEDHFLEPGDFISYYLEAEDRFHADPSMSDMYFIEITPFDASYSQAESQAQQQMPQNAQQQQSSQMVMSQQMIIAATWKLHRLRGEQTTVEFLESLDALVQAQENLRSNITERINSTAMSEEMVIDDDNLAIVNYLRAAVEEMGQAVTTLSQRELMEALKSEQRALNNLLRADALNKERQVQMQQQQASSSGSPGTQSEERMTELMDLELDISQDKYEMQQQQQAQQAEAMDDTMEKLRELAERQQKLADQSRDAIPQDEEEQRRFLDRLQRDQEELRQQAEELSSRLREMAQSNDQLSREMRERMEQIAETMQQAEQDLKNNNIQESMARQQQALNELNRLTQDMRFSMTDDARERLGEFNENFQQFREREERFADDLAEAAEDAEENNGRATDLSEVEELTAERRRILENLVTLDEQAATLEMQTMQENPDIAEAIRNFRNAIRREDIASNMLDQENFVRNGWLSYSLPLEEEIAQGLDALEEQMSGLEQGLPVTEEEQLSRSIADAREMRERLEDMMARNGRGEPQEQTDQQSPAGGSPNEDSEPREQSGQSGQRQARQDQQQQQEQQSPGQQGQQDQQAQNQQPQSGGGQPQSDRQNQQARGGNGDRDAVLQMERLMEQYDQLLDQLEEEFSGDRELSEVIETARRRGVSDYTGELLGEDADDRFREEIFDPLSQLEIALLKRLDEIDLERRLYSMRSADVPPQYKSMVDRYFESLAKQQNGE